MKTFFRKFNKHILLFTLIVLIGSYAINYSYKVQEDSHLKMQTNLLKAKYNTNYKYLKIVSNDIYQMYKNNKEIINTLEQAKKADKAKLSELRTSLFNLLKIRYRRLRNMGVEQFHFHLRDNTSFLRMHKPDKFGDNLSGIRQSVSMTNKYQTFTEGFEVGRVIHGFRFVYPLFNSKHEHLGSVEISFSSKQLVDIIADANFIDTHFLVSKKAVDKKIWNRELYSTSWENPNFLLEKKTHNLVHKEASHHDIQSNKLTKKIMKEMETDEAFSVSTLHHKKSIILSFVPILNIDKDKVLAYIVAYKNSKYLDTLHMQKDYSYIIFFVIIFLIFIFGFYIINSKERLQEMAHYDELTKLPNRSYFYIEFQRELKRAKRYRTNIALLFLDLDGFKNVNDSYGHGVGDQLLREVSSRIKSSVRDIDIVARLGGDEFTILLTDIAHKYESLAIAQKIIFALNKEFIIKRKTIFIGASIGISIYPEHGTNIDELIRKADNMMYNVKNNGKNSAKIYKKESL